MNKTWLTLIVLALFTLLVVIGYEFYLSVSGSNKQFDKTSPVKVNQDLGRIPLTRLDELQENILITNQELDQK